MECLLASIRGQTWEIIHSMYPALVWGSHLLTGGLAFAIAALLSGGFTCWGRPAAEEIFEGVTYGCKQMKPSEEGSGVVHWVRVDLTAPGIELYVTPLDASAISQGWQY